MNKEKELKKIMLLCNLCGKKEPNNNWIIINVNNSNSECYCSDKCYYNSTTYFTSW